MSILDTLEKDIKYSLIEINSEIKTQIFEEVYGEMEKGSYLETFLTGSDKNMPLWLEYTGHA